MPAIPAITAVAAVSGVGASIYGANKNAKAIKSTNDANIAAQKEADALNYRRWLETQGVGENGQAINTWLPRYATVNRAFGAPKKFRRIGTGPAMTATPQPTVTDTPVSMPSGSNSSSMRFGALAPTDASSLMFGSFAPKGSFF